MQEILIVGAGLFGSIAAKLCEEAGFSVRVFDDRREYSGSSAAGCVIKDEWLSSVGRERADKSLELLDRLYGLRSLEFKTAKSQTRGFVLDPKLVLCEDRAQTERIEKASPGRIQTAAGNVYEGIVLIAAGVWSRALVGRRMPPVRALCGSSFEFDGEQGAGIVTYAPYKQCTWFPRDGRTWFGDGTAILHHRYVDAYNDRTLQRAATQGLRNPVRMNFGMRPYVAPGGYLQSFGKNLWVSTGGAKNGCVLAAIQALEFVKGIT